MSKRHRDGAPPSGERPHFISKSHALPTHHHRNGDLINTHTHLIIHISDNVQLMGLGHTKQSNLCKPTYPTTCSVFSAIELERDSGSHADTPRSYPPVCESLRPTQSIQRPLFLRKQARPRTIATHSFQQMILQCPFCNTTCMYLPLIDRHHALSHDLNHII